MPDIPIPVTLKLPELLSNGLSDRVLAFNRGQWEIGRLMEIGGADAPIWIFDDEQSVAPDVTHWKSLPANPTADQPAAWTETRIAIQCLNDATDTDWYETIAWTVTPETLEERKAFARHHMRKMPKSLVSGNEYSLRLVQISTTVIE
jgi:hypothetical protein